MNRVASLSLSRFKRINNLTFLSALTIALIYFFSSKSLYAQITQIYSNSEDGVAGITSLMTAAVNNDIEGAKFFSKSGISIINQRNLGGATALHIASREKNFEIVNILIENGADVNIADNDGWTPIMRAARNGDEKIVEMLLKKGADISFVNSVGESVINHAAISDCAKCLVEIFKNTDLEKLFGKTLLINQINDSYIIARSHENQEIQKILGDYLDSIEKNPNSIEVKEESLAKEKEEILTEDKSAIKEKEVVLIEEKESFTKEEDLNKSVTKTFQQPKNSPKEISSKFGKKFRFVGQSSNKIEEAEVVDPIYIADQPEIFQSKVVNSEVVAESSVEKKSLESKASGKKSYKFISKIDPVLEAKNEQNKVENLPKEEDSQPQSEEVLESKAIEESDKKEGFFEKIYNFFTSSKKSETKQVENSDNHSSLAQEKISEVKPIENKPIDSQKTPKIFKFTKKQ